MNHTPKALGLCLIAVVALGACAPATGTPPALPLTQAATSAPSAGATVPATQAAAGTPSAAATSEPTAASTPVSPATAASFKSKDPTTFTYVPAPAEPDTLDPAEAYETGGGQVIQNTYDTLIFYDKGDAGSFIPQLATEVPSLANGGISADGMTYTFKIRAGVKFHNGDVLTPADVAYTFQRGLLASGLGSPQWLLFDPLLGVTASPNGHRDITNLLDPSGSLEDDAKGLQAADPQKLVAACQGVVRAIVADDAAGAVTFHLAQPWGPFLATLAGTWGSIVDHTWVAAHGGWNGDCHTWQNFYVPNGDEGKTSLSHIENGTGPYVLDHWTPNAEIGLRAFDSYWRTTPAWPGGPTGAPRLKTIVIKTNVAKFGTRLSALQAGQADVIQEDFSVDWVQADPLVGEACDAAGACQPAADPHGPLRVFTGLAPAQRSDIFFNFAIDTRGGNDFIGSGKLDGKGVPPDFFSDVHVRRAFNYCFDWVAYRKGVQLGEGAQSYDVMLPGELGTSDQDPHYSFDPAKCQAEFLASTLRGADGKGVWATGFHLTLPFNTAQQVAVPWRQLAAKILSQNLKAVNPKFVLDVIDLPWPTFLAAQQANKFPWYPSGWLEDIHDPNNWVVPYGTGVYATRQSLPPDLVKQLSVFINAGAEETDPARRAAIYQQFNQAYYDAAPAILLTVEYRRHYEQRWVQGYYYNPMYSSYYFYALAKQ